jgi:dihydroorotase
MKHTLIKNVRIVDDGKDFISDIYIKGERIEKIASNISLSPTLAFDEINGEELLLMPGMIDEFRISSCSCWRSYFYYGNA